MNFKHLLFGAIATLCLGLTNVHAQKTIPSENCEEFSVTVTQDWDCEGEIIKLDIQGGNPYEGEDFAYKIDWFRHDGPVFPELSNKECATKLPRDLYRVVIKDKLGCKIVFLVPAFEGPERLGGNVHIVAQDTIGSPNANPGTGVATVDIVGGMPFEGTGYDYKVDWFIKGGDRLDQFANQTTATDLAFGTYQVFVTDDNGCCLNMCFNILCVNMECEELVGALNNEEMVEEEPTTDGARVGMIDISKAIGSMSTEEAYKIDWYGPNGERIDRLANSMRAEDLMAGDYQVSVKSNDGCQVAVIYTVPKIEVDCSELVENSRTITPSGEDKACGAIELEVSGGTTFLDKPYDYKVDWFVKGGDRIDRLANKLNGDKLAPGTYQIMVFDYYRCCLTLEIEVPVGDSEPVTTVSNTPSTDSDIESTEDQTTDEPIFDEPIIPVRLLEVNAYPNPVTYQSGCEMNLNFNEEIQGVIEYYVAGVKRGEELVNGSSHSCNLSAYDIGLIHVKITSDKGVATVSCINLGCSGK
ncbi:hypothetical protein [Sediminitomix flava]|uniref:SprB-like repeat protein n=1 Tax=Sediminitomix flava TaxID=379075 RepID=A0A315ZGJ2_SEDFL|nr:hypothetical protein [Sediminitomix flava]PWJ43978.1 hypothetical protein BC781_101328 [Sediminitomix flava]